MKPEFGRATIEELMSEMRIGNHPAEEQIERYTMGRLPESQLAVVEEHLMVCERCRERVEEADQFLLSMRTALRNLEPEVQREPAWRAWFRLDWLLIPVPALGALAAVVLAVLVWQPWKAQTPARWQEVSLESYRGGGAGRVAPGAALRLTLITEGLAAGPATAQVVRLNGEVAATAELAVGSKAAVLELTDGLSAGVYWVRIRIGGETAREYSLTVSPEQP